MCSLNIASWVPLGTCGLSPRCGTTSCSLPHSSASRLVEITCKSSTAFWASFDVCNGLSKSAVTFHVGHLFPAFPSNPMFSSALMCDDDLIPLPGSCPGGLKEWEWATTGLETQLKGTSSGRYGCLYISVYTGQLNALCLKRRLLEECIAVTNHLISVKWANWEKSGIWR